MVCAKVVTTVDRTYQELKNKQAPVCIKHLSASSTCNSIIRELVRHITTLNRATYRWRCCLRLVAMDCALMHLTPSQMNAHASTQGKKTSADARLHQMLSAEQSPGQHCKWQWQSTWCSQDDKIKTHAPQSELLLMGHSTIKQVLESLHVSFGSWPLAWCCYSSSALVAALTGNWEPCFCQSAIWYIYQSRTKIMLW